MKGDMYINNQQSEGLGFLNNSSSLNGYANFFVNNDKYKSIDEPTETTKHLNDYDCNILKEDAYREVSDEYLKLEYKISRLESELNELDKQIQAARDISDYNTVEILSTRKKNVKEELGRLLTKYNEKGISSKISSSVMNLASPKITNFFSIFRKASDYIKDRILSGMSGEYVSIQELKHSLAKLENINKSVDELMTLQTPYGEAGEKYEQLSRYITKANAIQARISKIIK